MLLRLNIAISLSLSVKTRRSYESNWSAVVIAFSWEVYPNKGKQNQRKAEQGLIHVTGRQELP